MYPIYLQIYLCHTREHMSIAAVTIAMKLEILRAQKTHP